MNTITKIVANTGFYTYNIFLCVGVHNSIILFLKN